MKIRSMHLMKYGCFTDVRMDFTRQDSRFHLIYGNNEAGKSTALRAVSGLLYGIAPQTSDAFQHEMKDLRIAAELEASDGTCKSFVRRKGLRDTLLDVDGKPLPDNSLVKFLGGTAFEIFSSMFRLDHPSLVRGGGELLEGKGQLAESLFQAGTGITRLRRVLAELEDEANKLFRVRSQKSLVNAAVDAYTEIKDRSRTLCVIPSQWVEQGISLASKEEQLSGLKMKLSDLREKKERLNRFRLAIPHVDRRKEILTELEALNAVQLPGTSTRDRETAQRREEEALQRRERANLELSKFNSELSTSLHQPEFLAQAASINNAYERVDSYRQAIRDLPKVQVEQKHFDADAGRLLNHIYPGRSLSDSNTPTISIAQRTRIRTLAKKHLILQERIQTAASRAMSTENELKATQANFSTASVPKEATPLRQSLERVRKRGDLDVALRETLRSSTAAQELAKAELNRLTLYTGTLDDLEQLKVPSLETIDVVEAEFAVLNQQKQILATQKKENDQRAEQLATEISALQLGGEVPTETELSKSRERRQHGWLLVRAAWLDLTCTPEQIASYDPEAPLPEAYERSVLTADAIADRLRRESDRVARLGGLMADLDACQRRHAEITAEQFELASRIKVQEDQWCASWKPANISPSSPKEMRAWLTAQRSVIVRATEFRSSQRLVTELQSDVTTNTTDIRQALKEYPSCKVPEGGTLSALIGIGDQHVAHLAESSKVFEKLRDESIRLEREHAKTTLELSNARGELNKWCVDWENAIAPLTLGTDTQADEALAVLEALEALAAKQGESAALQTRIDDMTTHINSFSADVTRLIKLSEAPLDALTLDDALVHLHDLLTIAQNDAVRRQTVESQIKVESQSLEIAEAQILDARRTLQGLMDRAHCATVEALQEAEVKSDRRRELEGKLAETLQTIAGFTAGVGLDTFLEEITEVVADQLPFKIEELERETLQLDQTRSQLDQEVGKERASIASTDTTGLAALAADEAHARLATIRAYAERHVQLQLAKEILRHHIDRFREQNQDPIIKRASELFPRLTVGSFASLKTGFDEKDRPILLGVRPNGTEVDVKGMSDGTRDQLFLSLRIASLERQLTAVEPLPLIVDDILVNFDDERAKVTLQILGELSHHTQVLFFTHHSRLKEIATSVIASDRLTITSL